MEAQLQPFNIDLLVLNDESLKTLQQITVLDTMDGATRNFHQQGLFSTEIFGKVGDERRNRRFAYLDMRVKILHPIVHRALCDTKRLYGEILSGSTFATWDPVKKDFIKADPGDGDTGYHYFLSHFEELVFEQRPSTKREFNILMLNKFRTRCQIDKLVVMPAGLRDFEIDDNGKPTDNEINDFYRRLMGMASLITVSMLKTNPESVDRTRHAMQIVFNELYEYIKNLLEGKKKLILGKWGSRKIFNGTRNVITTVNTNSDILNDPNNIGTNNTIVGLYQFMKAALPVTMFHLRSGFLSKVFVGQNAPVFLVNKKTLKKEMVNIDATYFDDWMTDEGIEKVVTRFGEEDLRHLPLLVDKYYMGLTYRGPDGTFALMQDINDLPKDRDPAHVTPMTFCELMYASVYHFANGIPVFVTRYPITGYGSIYPSLTYLKSTTKAEVRYELHPERNWEREEIPAGNFPITGEQFTNSMSPAPKQLGRLTADFDGDMTSLNAVYTDEAIEEVKKMLASRAYHVGPNGRMNFSAATDTINYVLASITG